MCDVGILVGRGPGDDPISSLELRLPFGPDGDGEDLFEQICNRNTAELIFAERGEIRQAEKGLATFVQDNGHEVSFRQLNHHQVEPVPKEGVWKCTLGWRGTKDTAPLEYVRVRFHIGDLDTSWLWQRHGGIFRNRGALMDLRVTDIRDSPPHEEAEDTESRILAIDVVNMFLIVPWDLKLKSSSPLTTQTRVLEEEGWPRYLGRKVSSRKRDKALVHYWRSTPTGEPDGPHGGEGTSTSGPDNEEANGKAADTAVDRPVTLQNSFQVFADFGREPGLRAGEYVLLFVVAAVAVALFSGPNAGVEVATTFVASVLIAVFAWFWSWITAVVAGVGLIWLIMMLKKSPQKLKDLAKRIGKWRRKLERRLTPILYPDRSR